MSFEKNVTISKRHLMLFIFVAKVSYCLRRTYVYRDIVDFYHRRNPFSDVASVKVDLVILQIALWTDYHLDIFL